MRLGRSSSLPLFSNQVICGTAIYTYIYIYTLHQTSPFRMVSHHTQHIMELLWESKPLQPAGQGIVHLEVISEAAGRNEKQGKKRHGHLTPANVTFSGTASNNPIAESFSRIVDGEGLLGSLLKVEIGWNHMHSDSYLELSKKMAELLAVRWRFDSFCQKHHEASFHRQKSLLYFYTITYNYTDYRKIRDNWNIKIPMYFSISPNLEFGHHFTGYFFPPRLKKPHPVDRCSLMKRSLSQKVTVRLNSSPIQKWELLAFNNFKHHGVVVS